MLLLSLVPPLTFDLGVLPPQTTEAQQPGAVARGDRGGAGESLHRHGVHGQGQTPPTPRQSVSITSSFGVASQNSQTRRELLAVGSAVKVTPGYLSVC